jgi:signal transduction histidine kinase
MENEFLRIVQEALTNVGKHAAASKVHIRWSIADGRGILVVEDDGRGFDPALGIRGNAYGLVGMRERAASVGAILSISSEPGQGTTITVQSSQHPNR